MKKLLLASSIIFIIALLGCKKDYVCACKGYDDPVLVADQNIELNNSKKKEAEDACEVLSERWKLGGSSGCFLE